MSRSTSPRPEPVVSLAAEWDAVVVGARVAGASTALLLARAGLRVLVLDRARLGADTLSTHALMRGGALQLHRWGLLDSVVASGAPPVRRVTFHYGTQTVPITLKPQARIAALYAPRRTVLDPILVAAAEAAGATFRFGATVTDLVRDEVGRVTGVVARFEDPASRIVRAGIVVGADGRDSMVAHRVQARVLATGRHVGTYAYGYWPAGDVDGYHWYYGRHGGQGVTAGVIPTNDGLACVFFGEPAGTVDGEAAHRRLAGRLGGPVAELTARAPVGRVRRFRGRTGRLRSAYGPGWALVGDAGIWLDPLSTHGITEALREAELLADAIVDDRPGAMAGFQAERDRIARPMLGVTDALASHRWDLATVRRLLGELADLMAEETDALRALDAPSGRSQLNALTPVSA